MVIEHIVMDEYGGIEDWEVTGEIEKSYGKNHAIVLYCGRFKVRIAVRGGGKEVNGSWER